MPSRKAGNCSYINWQLHSDIFLPKICETGVFNYISIDNIIRFMLFSYKNDNIEITIQRHGFKIGFSQCPILSQRSHRQLKFKFNQYINIIHQSQNKCLLSTYFVKWNHIHFYVCAGFQPFCYFKELSTNYTDKRIFYNLPH